MTSSSRAAVSVCLSVSWHCTQCRSVYWVYRSPWQQTSASTCRPGVLSPVSPVDASRLTALNLAQLCLHVKDSPCLLANRVKQVCESAFFEHVLKADFVPSIKNQVCKKIWVQTICKINIKHDLNRRFKPISPLFRPRYDEPVGISSRCLASAD